MTTANPININLPKSKRRVRLTMTVIPFIALLGYSLLSLHWQEHNEFVIYPLFAFSGLLLNCLLSCCIFPFAACIAWILNGWSSRDTVGRRVILIFLLCAGFMLSVTYGTFYNGQSFEHESSIQFNDHIYQVVSTTSWDPNVTLIIFECDEQGWICSKLRKSGWYTSDVSFQVTSTGDGIELVSDIGEIIYTYVP